MKKEQVMKAHAIVKRNRNGVYRFPGVNSWVGIFRDMASAKKFCRYIKDEQVVGVEIRFLKKKYENNKTK